MIKKERKLAKEDFKVLKKPDQLIRSKLLNAKVFKVEGAPTSRFSFNISKKVEKKAVLRNKAKRIGFLALRPYLGKIISGLVIQFNFISLPQDISEVESDIANIIKNIK